MKRSFKLLVAALLLFSVVMPLQSGQASAATNDPQGFNIITSPLPTKLTTTPGQTVQTQLRLKNQGGSPETIKVGLMKFGATGNSGEPDLFSLTAKDTYASWVSFSPSQFVAEPNVWNTVTVTIKVPKEASLGYYLAVTFSRASQAGQVEATNLKGAVASLLLLEVKTPNEHRSIALNDFTTNHKLYEYLPATFNVTLHNNGNIYMSPVGNIFILRGSKPVSTIDFNDAGGSVLPGANRLFHVPWSDGFPVYKERLVNGKPVYDEHDQPRESLSWDFTHINKLRIGKYTAKLLVVYDNGTNDVPLESTLSFWVIPWKLLLILLVVVALIGFGLWNLLKSTLRKAKSGVSKAKRLRK